jgi:anti-sigma factor RsiW
MGGEGLQSELTGQAHAHINHRHSARRSDARIRAALEAQRRVNPATAVQQPLQRRRGRARGSPRLDFRIAALAALGLLASAAAAIAGSVKIGPVKGATYVGTVKESDTVTIKIAANGKSATVKLPRLRP